MRPRGARIALVGLGGTGKSQLAIKYGYHVHDSCPDTWVLWIHASSAARFDQDIRKLAIDADIPGHNDPNAELLELVYNWLSNVRNGKWLLVLDNADDIAFLIQAPGTKSGGGRATRTRMAYLPVCDHGSVLITSRSRAAALQLVEDRDIVVINPMDENSAVALLQKKLGLQSDAREMKKLASTLEYMPLAISQAAAYIKRRVPRCSIEQYLTKYEANENSRSSLLKSTSTELRRDAEAQDSILLTWQISFEHIRDSRRSAADLLSLMSFYNHQGIPEVLMRMRNTEATALSGRTDDLGFDGREDNTGSQVASDESFDDDDIVLLQDYLFVSTMPSSTSFQMHRLVQFAARAWLESHGSYQHWASRSIENLEKAFPDGEYKNWEQCQLLYPHVGSALDIGLDNREALLQLACVQYMAAWFDLFRGSLLSAEALAVQSLEARTRILGPEESRTLESQSILAIVQRQEGNYEAAEKMHRLVLKGRERTLGREHPDTLASLNNLAVALREQGKYEAAEEMSRRALQGRKKVLGKEHPDTLLSVSNVATVLQHQGKYEAAEEMDRQALGGREKVLGKEHPDTLVSVNSLAVLLREQGNYEVAEEMHRRAIEGQEKVLGKEHPRTLRSVADLAVVLQEQGKYEAAEAISWRVLEEREKVLGKEHPDTLRSVWNLASVVDRLGRRDEAVSLYERALKGFVGTLGKEHPSTVRCQRDSEAAMNRT